MKRIRNPEQKRKQIIEATNRILLRGGHFTNFSLSKVAEEAGISKGGLMHHFASKEALLRAVAEESISQFETIYDTKLAQEPTELPGRSIRAYINTVLEDEPHQQSSPILLAFLRAGQDDPTAQTRFAYWQAILNEGDLDPALAAIIRLAVDGLLYTEVIDTIPLSSTLRQEIRAKLLQLVDESVAEI